MNQQGLFVGFISSLHTAGKEYLSWALKISLSPGVLGLSLQWGNSAVNSPTDFCTQLNVVIETEFWKSMSFNSE